MKKVNLFLMAVFAMLLTFTSVHAEEAKCNDTQNSAKYSITFGSTIKYCNSITDAFNEVSDNGTVTLLQEDTITTMAKVSNKNVTFDLKGKTLNANVNKGAGLAFVGSNVTIKDSSTGGKIASNNGVAVLVATGSLTLESGTLEASNTYSALQVGQSSTSATFTMKNGTIDNKNAEGGFALNIVQGSATINGGDIKATTTNTIAVGSSEKTGNLVINSGTVENNHTNGESNKAIIIVNGETNVKGGKVTSSSPGSTIQVGQPNGPDTVKCIIEGGEVTNTNTNAGIGILVARGETTVKGGTVTSEGTSATIQVGNSKDYTAKLTVEKGTIENKKNVPAVFVPYGGSEATITGGTIKINENDNTSKNDVAIMVGHNKANSEDAGEEAKVTITNGDITGGIALFGKKPILDIKGGNITAKSFAVSGNGSPEGSLNATINSTINITGGNLTSTSTAAIYQPQTGTLNISKGNITGKIGIVARQGDINITGGHITATGEGTASVGDAEKDGKKVELPLGTAIIVDNTEDGYAGKANVKVSGGDFKTSSTNPVMSIGNDATDIQIEAGAKFNKKVDPMYLEEGLVQTSDGKIATLSSLNPSPSEEKDDKEDKEDKTPVAPESQKPTTDAENPDTSDNFFNLISIAAVSISGLFITFKKYILS